MNRAIKFRAFIDGEMIDADALAFEEYLPVSMLLTNCENIMQFTGLHDKNGKEIYEGDILKPITNYLYKFGNYGQIEYEADYGGYICIGEYSKNQHHERLGCDLAFECEIIGNIHQNPDLLK